MRSAAPLLLLLASVLPAQVVINEISTGNVDWIEVANLGSAPVTLTGWSVQITDSGTGFATFTFPAGTVIAPFACIILTETSSLSTPVTASGVQKFWFGTNIPWATQPGTSGGACALLSGAAGVDTVNWSSPPNPLHVAPTAFCGTIASPAGAIIWRSGNADTNGPVDWSASTANTAGALNPGQVAAATPRLLIDISSGGPGQLTLTVTSIDPPVPNGEIFNLVSLMTSSPTGCGPVFGVGSDVLPLALLPFDPTGLANPFHTLLGGAGVYTFAVPSGVPSGVHLEAVSILVSPSIRVSPVDILTTP